MTDPLFLPDYTGVSSALAYAGMLSILFAFVMETRGLMSSRGSAYLLAMAVGSALLGVRAAHMREWAFFLLETVWCAAAVWALARPRR